ncbi:MAG: selenide, water dikinase, partial [Candidatus Hydrogenedentes bacterium]|nr:selenide, water dikinase [Candidatus Hydrogenedentota bacterium]
GAHACTDVTGFGLAGHLVAMARGSGVSVQIDLSRVPVFAAAAECLERGIVPGAVERNAADTAAWVKAEDEARPYLPILYDPQTSGGLLVCLPEAPGRGYVEAMHARGHCATAIVGRIVEVMPNSDGEAIVVNGVLEHLIGSRGILDAPVPMEGEAEVECCCGGEAESCCATPPVAEIEEENRVDGLAMFSEFMKEANKAGRIDARNKKLMAIALSIAHKCHPCLKIPLESAVKLGIAREDIDEAAQLAIAFGGCTAMMFYKEVCKEVGL